MRPKLAKVCTLFAKPMQLMCFPINVLRKTRKKKKKLGLFLISMCLLVVVLDNLFWVLQPSHVTQTCKFHNEKLNYHSMDQSFWVEQVVHCDMWKSLVNFDKNGMLRMNETNIEESGHTNITCSYSTIHLNGQNDVRMSDYVVFKSPAFIPFDVVHVLCKTANGSHAIYSNIHYKVEKSKVVNERKLQNESNDQLSILILGLDSVSNVVAKRMLSKHTIPYLRDELKAYFMEGYTRVGENTLPNLIAALLGKSLPELLIPSFETSFFEKMLNKGYIDCNAEDWTSYVPTTGVGIPEYTHYLRKLFLAKEKVDIFLKESGDITKNRYSNRRPLCVGNELIYKLLLKYTRQCFEAYGNTRKYVFMWQNELGHHQSNFVQLADEDIKQLLQWLKESGRLENAVVIVMGDHGPRYGPVPKTVLGRFTGRFPFLSIVIPDHLKSRYPQLHKNLEYNTMRLTSPFDLHEMLKDVINQKFTTLEPITGDLARGISLFREIPANRSCYDAGISENHCGCYSYSNVSTKEPNVERSAIAVVDKINDNLKEYKNLCATVKLSSVESATVQHVPSTMLTSVDATRYVLAVKTVPGDALFEATIEIERNNVIHIIGDISRRNRYGGQIACFINKNKIVEPFCYCKIGNTA